MIERPLPTHPRVRAGTQAVETPRHWMQDRAPSFKSLARDRQRRERAWAWLSLVVLIICWDASSRLGERVSPPRPKFAHVTEDDDLIRTASASTITVDL